MEDVATFVAEVAESWRREQITALAGFVTPPDLCLSRALEIALEHRWLIAPVRGCSAWVLNSSDVDLLSRERVQIEDWLVEYGRDTNWMLRTGKESGVVAIEVYPILARYSVSILPATTPPGCARCDSRFMENGRFCLRTQRACGRSMAVTPAFACTPAMQSSCRRRAHLTASRSSTPIRTPHCFVCLLAPASHASKIESIKIYISFETT
jgi:hypothetical protein